MAMLTVFILSVVTSSSLTLANDPWADNLSPKLRVNYLSQKSGKTDTHLF